MTHTSLGTLYVQQGSIAAWDRMSEKEQRDHCAEVLQGLKADSLSAVANEVLLEPPFFAEAVGSLAKLGYEIR